MRAALPVHGSGGLESEQLLEALGAGEWVRVREGVEIVLGSHV